MDDAQTDRAQVVTGYIDNIKEHGFSVFQSVHGLERLELLTWSDTVVAAYGKVYKQHKGLIDDMQLLPLPKDHIKVALKIQFFGFAVKKNEEAMKTITNAYVNLCRFQAMSPDDAQMLEELNITSIPQVNPFEERDPGQLSEQERRYLKCFQTFQRYLCLVEDEKEFLRQDFTVFVKELFNA